jgi:hypothetical protein
MEELGSAVDSGLAESRKLGADAKMKKIEAIAIQANFLAFGAHSC